LELLSSLIHKLKEQFEQNVPPPDDDYGPYDRIRIIWSGYNFNGMVIGTGKFQCVPAVIKSVVAQKLLSNM
jgi:hypothetical protein